MKNNLTFSLFVDDITLSSKEKIDNKILREIIRLMGLYELRLKKEKTKFYSKNNFKIVTGVAITPSNRLTYPNKTMNKINRSLEICDKKLHNLSYKEIESTLGRANYLKMIDKRKYVHLSKALTEINKENLRKRKALQNVV